MTAALLALTLFFAQSTPSAQSPFTTSRLESSGYEANFLKLSEMMGALSYLRELCRFGDGQIFRERYATLLQIDKGSEEVKAEMAGAFNRGYGGYKLTYRNCTSNSRKVIEEFLAQSQRLARKIARYGPG